MKINELGLEEIIKRMSAYSEKNDSGEMRDNIRGEKRAYDSILKQLDRKTSEFIYHFSEEKKELDVKDEEQFAYLSEIGKVIKLINPWSEYDTEVASDILRKYENMYPNTPRELTFPLIIQNKLFFVENNRIFDPTEFRYYNRGEIEAYSELLGDVYFAEEKFYQKYEKVVTDNLNYIDEYRESDYESFIMDKENNEKLIGYNNAILEVLELLNPEIQFI